MGKGWGLYIIYIIMQPTGASAWDMRMPTEVSNLLHGYWSLCLSTARSKTLSNSDCTWQVELYQSCIICNAYCTSKSSCLILNMALRTNSIIDVSVSLPCKISLRARRKSCLTQCDTIEGPKLDPGVRLNEVVLEDHLCYNGAHTVSIDDCEKAGEASSTTEIIALLMATLARELSALFKWQIKAADLGTVSTSYKWYNTEESVEHGKDSWIVG